MSAYAASARFGCPGELVYLLRCEGGAVERLARAVSGRVVRSLAPVDAPSAGPREALAAALGRASAGPVGASVRLSGAADLGAAAGLFVVSVRREDRERFEETMGGAPRRYLGATREGTGLDVDDQ